MMKFGDRITVTHKLIRDKTGTMHKWRPWPIPETQVMVIGKRTLNNGRAEYFNDHIEYDHKEYITAHIVVATSGRTNPFYIPVERQGE